MYLSYYLGSPLKLARLLASGALKEFADPRRVFALLKGLLGRA